MKISNNNFNFIHPELELLEDRCVLDALVWRPQVGTDWATKGNWFDNTTNAVFSNLNRVINSSDDILFDANSGLNCSITASTTCHSLSSTNGWGGILSINNGSQLNIWGATGVTYTWGSGRIIGDAGNNVLQIAGGTFEYQSNINNASGSLDIYIFNGGTLQFDLGARSIGSNIYVGQSVDPDIGFPMGGTLTFTSINRGIRPTLLGTGINVSSTGNLNISSILDAAKITSWGNLFLDSGSFVTMDIGETLWVFGGVVTVGEGANPATVSCLLGGGRFSIQSATLQMGTSENNYGTLNVIGPLDILNYSTYSCDVDATDNGRCDVVSASEINLDETDTVDCYTWGSPLAGGAHSHQVLRGRFGLTGEFGTYTWNGDNPLPLPGFNPWDTSYTVGGAVVPNFAFVYNPPMVNAGDVMLWRPEITGNYWNDAGNWFDATTNETLTSYDRPNGPSTGDNVVFDDVSGSADCNLINEAVHVNSINSTSDYSGTLNLRYVDLIVDGSYDSSSSWMGGSIVANSGGVANAAYLDIAGGYFNYGASQIGNNTSDLTVYVSGDSVAEFSDSFSYQDAHIYVGINSPYLGESASPGKLVYNAVNYSPATITMGSGYVDYIVTQGTLEVGQVDLTNSTITVFGVLVLDDNSEIDMAYGQPLSLGSGSSLLGPNTLGGNATINGSVGMYNSSVALGNDHVFSQITINGNLSITGGTSYSVDLDNAAVLSDALIVSGDVVLDDVSFYAYDDSEEPAGECSVLTANNIDGVFSSYGWSNTSWSVNYTSTDMLLDIGLS